MKTIESWHEEQFRTEIRARVVEALGKGADATRMASTLAASADNAQSFCVGRPYACAAGCPHCCVLNVAVLLPEATTIALWLRESLSGEELAGLQKRLGTHRSWARWMDDDERILKQMACPLLDQYGACSVHPVRPLACRAITSLDSQSCREAFRPTVTDEDRLVPADLFRKAVFDAAFTAVASALRQVGLDDRSIELGTGVLAFLEHPELVQAFLGGERMPQTLWL
ncbi:YkgJ family cysteine cluster protein [Geomonas anaerohicana]|uniref:YkgJ family cysteine cluster protein n=1 Tax=Geomonas anaerohicana TaxID=2798583 RepID=A0ABS0YI67_9BACT|nr:YkgJ family cysteine cluster protein [Geomonas anaerohicana]MBJ6752037.1 YkgJ family cysteine cluster protein [Geomonas anaerohicana]